MTNKEKVLDLLRAISPEAIGNAEIVSRTGITPHQQVFQITEALMRENLIRGSRNGKEWAFSWPPRESIKAPSQRSVNGRKLVTHREELLASCMRFLELEHGSPEQQKFFAGRIKNVKRFVAIPNLKGSFDFVPGAYAAYSDSYTLSDWEQLGVNACRTPGRQYLDQALANDKIDIGDPDYAQLTDAFHEFCRDRNIIPSVSEEPLRFWLLSETQGPFEPRRSNKDETEYWTDNEFEAAVKAYAQMLRTGDYKPFSRNEILKKLKAGPLSKRTETSIIYRMKNISSVLATLGKPYIEKYKPAHHVGRTGIDKIAVYLEQEGLLKAGDYKPATKNTGRTSSHSTNKKSSAGVTLDAWQTTLGQIVGTVKGTAANSNGQAVERILKNKELRCSEEELKEHIVALRASQDGKCAITDLPLQCVGEAEDPELIYSLDRIDSNGHYEPGNLQLVCRFINRWKSDGDNTEFQRLIKIVRES